LHEKLLFTLIMYKRVTTTNQLLTVSTIGYFIFCGTIKFKSHKDRCGLSNAYPDHQNTKTRTVQSDRNYISWLGRSDQMMLANFELMHTIWNLLNTQRT